MHARVTHFEGSPDRVDAGIKLMTETTIPEAKKIPGFAGGYWCIDRMTGKGMAITVWESEDAMRASEQKAAQLRTEAAEEVRAPEMKVMHYEVVGQA